MTEEMQGSDFRTVYQGLKPACLFCAFAARLKPCPFKTQWNGNVIEMSLRGGVI